MPSVKDAAGGPRVDLLRALRDTIAATIDDDCPPRDLASLSRRLLDISKELEDIEGEGRGTVGEAAAADDELWDG